MKTLLKIIPTTRSQISLHIRRLAALPIPKIHHSLKQKSINSHLFNETYNCIIILLAKRLERMSNLRYLTLMNPHIAKIWNAYIESFKDILSINFEDNGINCTDNKCQNEFISKLNKLLNLHLDNVIDLRDGIKETSKYVDQAGIFAGLKEKEFLNEHLSERILLKLISQNYLSINKSNKGLLDNNLNIVDILHRSIEFVNGMANLKYGNEIEFKIKSIEIFKNNLNENITKINENVDLNNDLIKFSYIGSHIEYILQEILKNSTRALLENKIFLKPIKILLVLDKTNINNQTLQIKISDLGGGIRPDLVNKLWEYSFTTANNDSLNLDSNPEFDDNDINSNISPAIENLGNTDENIIAGMGYGLPLSLTYCKLFGGNIKLESVWNQGTDVYIVLKSL